ncbi:MAG: YybS family protein, partial [Bacillota bacterium]|nr:YybS family protein [Bacillota bacterium]
MADTKVFSPRVIADFSIVAALSVVLVLTAAYAPFLGTLAMLIWAVPLMALVQRRGLGAAVLALIVISVASVLLAGVVSGLFSVAWIGFFGLVYGVCFRKRVSPLSTLAAGTLISGIIMVAALALGAVLGAFSFDSFIATMTDTMNEVIDMYESAGVLGQLLPQGMTVEEYQTEVLDLMKMILPACFIVYGMISAALNYIFAAVILRRLNYDITPLPPFRDWHFPWWILWAIVVALIAYLMGNQWPEGHYHQIALNILYIYLPIFLISGISMVAWLLHAMNVRRGTKMIVWVACLFLARF